MKTRIVVLILTLTVSFVGCIPGQITVEMPSVANAFRNPSITISNFTPWGGSVIALDKNVCKLSPGWTLRARKDFEPFDYTELPVIVSFYDMKDGHFIGAWWEVIPIVRDQPVHIEIRPGDVRYPDERQAALWNGSSPPYPSPDFGGVLEDEKVIESAIPRIGAKSTTVIQVYNISLFEERIRIDGKQAAARVESDKITDVYHTDEMFYLESFNPFEYAIPTSLSLVFTDRGRLVGTFSTTFVKGKEPHAYQYVIMPSQIQRY